MTAGRARRRLARWLESTVDEPRAPHAEEPPPPAESSTGEAWQGICDRFSLQILGLAEQLRPALDHLESDEQDPDRLQRLYEIDHAITRMRRSARDLRVLADRDDEELDGHVTSLMDAIRVAESSIEHYTRVEIGTVAELAVVPYAADDVASILAVLLENATGYSPSTVAVSAHLLETGGVMFRIEDTGIGLEPHRIEWLNSVLAGEVPPVDERTGKRTGFPVAHRLARRHDIGVRLMGRAVAGMGRPAGTTAMVTLPPPLVCEIPTPAPAIGRQPSAAPSRPTHLAVAARPEPGTSEAPRSSGAPTRPQPVHAAASTLPRRERKSLRGPEAGTSAGPGRSLAREDSGTVSRSFADDLSAFSAGGQGQAPPGSGQTRTDEDRPEEEVP